MSNIQIHWRRCLGLTILAIGLVTACLRSQPGNRDRPIESLTDIFGETFSYESDSSGKVRVDIYVQVPYTEINFVKEGNLYAGRFEISAALLTQEKKQVWQKSQLVELRLPDFSQTISNRLSSLKQFSADFLPGRYELSLQVVDLESKKIAVLQRSVVVKDYHTDSLALSDLMLVYRVNVHGARRDIVPNLTGILRKEMGDSYLFFEIYNHSRLDSVQMSCKFVNSKQEIITQRTKNEVLSGNRTQVIWQMDTLQLAADHYVLSVEAVGYPQVGSEIQLHASVSRTCIVQLMNLPPTINDIGKAADQLRYIATETEIDSIREAATPEERLKRFLEFWAPRDLDPKTPRNELMEEYYSRVDYANKNFPSYMEGWKTDRGMVLIRFGPPQNIDRHPFDAESKPYEIWYYYDQNREFVFVDVTGFGDYRLRYPTTDLWGKIR